MLFGAGVIRMLGCPATIYSRTPRGKREWWESAVTGCMHGETAAATVSTCISNSMRHMLLRHQQDMQCGTARGANLLVWDLSDWPCFFTAPERSLHFLLLSEGIPNCRSHQVVALSYTS